MRIDRVTISLTGDEEMSQLRRVVGPTSWMVFEELLFNSTVDESEVRVARRSIRDLAASLGLAKDTVARAVQRLRVHGLVSAVQARSTSGTFDAGTYRLGRVESVRVVSGPNVPVRGHEASAAASAGPLPGQLALAVEG